MAFQGDSIYWVELEKVVPNPFQPRREFDQKKLEELSESIRMYGVLQPLTVTRNEVQRDDGTFYTEYELIAGERRLRASKLAGVAQVPVIIREGEQSEQEKLELAIIENLQREDLNAVDRALAFRQLAESFGLSHAQVAEKVGRSREYVSNSIRLLGLPDHILDSLKRGDLMEGHARTLLMLTDRPQEQEVIFREILLKKLSVREVERIVRKIATEKVRKKNAKDLDGNLIELEKQFTETLGTRVQIQKTDFGGKLTIDYFSEDDLSVILKRIGEEAGVASSLDDTEAKKLSDHTGLEVDDRPREPNDNTNHQSAPLRPEEPVEEPVPAPHTPEIQVPDQPPVNPVPENHVAAEQVVRREPVNPSPAPLETVNAHHGPREVSPAEEYTAAPIPPPPPAPAPQEEAYQPSVPSAEPAESLPAWHERSPESVEPQIKPEPEKTPVEEVKEDDSDLYSIRNFNV